MWPDTTYDTPSPNSPNFFAVFRVKNGDFRKKKNISLDPDRHVVSSNIGLEPVGGLLSGVFRHIVSSRYARSLVPLHKPCIASSLCLKRLRPRSASSLMVGPFLSQPFRFRGADGAESSSHRKLPATITPGKRAVKFDLQKNMPFVYWD